MTAPQFAVLLQRHRREARMTQRELAVKSGVSVRAISDMERGFSSAPQARTLGALADALGLDPTRRAALTAAARSSRVSRASRAWDLPRDLPDFTGRSAELTVLADHFRTSGVLLLHGPPGAGKTALAVHAAGRLGGRASFVSCRDLTTGKPADTSGELPGLASGELLILDGVTDESQVAPLLPGPGHPVVITSRRALTGLGGLQRVPVGLGSLRRVPVGALPVDDASRLLATVTGVPDDHPELRRVAEYCEFLPLALRAAGNRLVSRPGWTIGDLAVRLADPERRLAGLTAGDLSVERVLAAAYAESSPAERRALTADSALFSSLATAWPGGSSPS
ncbi:MAG TPA: helix-turn-helix domain-containing protein [Actinoplanes sp.]|nr:helix-turn-helix domain-containing protein [Actinoplanes sp.]